MGENVETEALSTHTCGFSQTWLINERHEQNNFNLTSRTSHIRLPPCAVDVVVVVVELLPLLILGF